MEKVKILVACHKPYDGYRDEVYTPIHVGRANSKYKDEMADMIGDNTGDNISDKNPKYCELTAQYWAWKNLSNVEYIGFCHYRRFFTADITENNIEHLFRNNDVIAIKYHYDIPMYWELVKYISLDNLTVLLMVIKKLYPNYEQTMIDYLYGNILYPKNMFICKKSVFDKYSKWLFDILCECEKYIGDMHYTRLNRTLAYMGEYLLTVYILHNNLKVRTVDFNKCPCRRDRLHQIRRALGNVLRDIKCKIYNMNKRKPKSLDRFYVKAVLVGFKQDGISI